MWRIFQLLKEKEHTLYIIGTDTPVENIMEDREAVNREWVVNLPWKKRVADR
jgi:hypothetical protein